jgi:hypothetical protein
VRKASVCAHRIDLPAADQGQRDDRRNAQRCSDEEHGLWRDRETDGTHCCRRDTITDRSEACVATQARTDGGMTDETQCDGANRRPENRTRSNMKQFRQ